MHSEQTGLVETDFLSSEHEMLEHLVTANFAALEGGLISERAAEPVSPHELMEVRNALKLSGKAMGALADALRAQGDFEAARRCETGPVAAGFLLALAGEPRHLVIAAFLHEAYRAFRGPALRAKIERSFGAEVLELLEGGGADVREGLRLEQALTAGGETAEFGQPEIALQQYSRHEYARYSGEEIAQIQRALVFAGRLYDGVRRAWGPHERVPMLTHAADVGMLLALSGAPAEVVQAGILHDALEKYNINGRSREQIRAELQTIFDPRVVELIEAVTEPREGETWHERKLRVIINVAALWRRDRQLGQEAATIVCASKASTIASGNKSLYQGVRAVTPPEEVVTQWSGGTYQENIEHFKQLRALCRITGVEEALIGQLSEEISRFERPGPTRNRRYPGEFMGKGKIASLVN